MEPALQPDSMSYGSTLALLQLCIRPFQRPQKHQATEYRLENTGEPKTGAREALSKASEQSAGDDVENQDMTSYNS